ncbi:MAG: DUF3999 family protein [Methylomonas sp.]|jgi:hypothetical protein
MILKFAVLGYLGMLISQALAAEPAAERFSRPVVRPDAGNETLLAVALDQPVYAACQDGFGDLRLLDRNGVETPYLLQKMATRKTVPQRLPSGIETQTLQKIGADGIAVTLGLDKEAASADGLTIVTGQHDFEYELQIQASADGKTWRTLVDKAAIYDYSRNMAVDNRDVALPANHDRFFKIIVAKAGQTHVAEIQELTRTLNHGQERERNEKQALRYEPLHIERIEAWHAQAQTLPETAARFEYPLAAFNISQDAAHKTSLIDIDSPRLPLTGFKLQIKTANFSRNAEVEIDLRNGVESSRQVIGAAQLQALHFQDINRERAELAFPEQRREHYRIVIQNQDNPPLDIASVTGVGAGYQLLFLPQAENAYRLYYGADKAAPPVYDTASIRELLDRGYQITPAALGAEIAEAAINNKFDIGEWLNSSLLLGVMIALMVVVLVWSLYRVGKRVGNMPE